jgi:putative transferase (TIGR04331 family)
MRRLYLGQIPLSFSPDKDSAFSVNCFLGREQVYPEWEKLPFIRSLNNADLLKKAEAQIASLAYHNILPKLVNDLNAQHNTSYDLNFWCFILNPWLFTALNLSWILYYQLTNFIDHNKSERFLVELISQDSWEFLDTMGYMENGLLNINFHHWILSEFLPQLSPRGWELYYDTQRNISTNAIILPRGQSGKIINLKEKAKEKAIKVLMRQRCAESYGLSIFQRLLWSAFLSLKPIRPERAGAQGWKWDHPEAHDQFKDFFSDEFLRSLEIILKKSMPLSFTRNFSEYDEPARQGRYSVGKIRLVSGGYRDTDRLNFRLAHAEQSGERIVMTQHGGNYGNAKVFPLGNDTEFRHYAFFTWGWDRYGNYQGNFLPVAHPYLGRLAGKYNRENDSLILVAARLSPQVLRIHSKPLGERLIYCRKERINFLNHLRKEIFKRTLYRPHVPKGTLEDEQYLKEKFCNLSICVGKLHPQLLRCKLLVLDNPLTTLNIAMAANIPLICFWDQDDWVMWEGAVPYFRRLAEVGILLKSGKEAAEKVNEVWSQIDEWWQQPDIQNARQEWSRKFARAHPQWWREWLKTLWKM